MKEDYQKRIDESTIRKWEKQGRPLPPPHIAKVRTIAKKQAESGYRTLVESGTFMGDMIDAQMKNFDKIYSIELSDELFQKAVEKYRGNEKVHLLNGDSGKVLRDLIPNLKEPAIFWLDGHYSGGITAKGEKICPVYAELDAILKSDLAHMILIDDARLFVGEDDYPTIEELKSYLNKSDRNHSFEKEDDTIILKRIDESAA
tara:strand:- start:2624 stop:3229 length:606 start_codon:yes stop_codon:yes gene_type:complete